MQKESSSSVRIFYPESSREEIVVTLREMTKALDRKLPLKLAMLFGSYAAGNYTVRSDVDVLIVYRGEEHKEAYTLTKKTLDIPRLEPHVYSEGQWEEMRMVIEKMARKGIMLFGTNPLPFK